MPRRRVSVVITCEHASHRIPVAYQSVAERAGSELTTHRGYDPGALELARKFARHFDAPLFTGKWSRLLIELNRSLHHRNLFSEFSNPLDERSKRELIENYYKPYRQSVSDFIRARIKEGRRVVHIGMHSFTPVLKGEVRRADVAFLYDPASQVECDLCNGWSSGLKLARPDLRVRRNYPYRGTDDGFTTALRAEFGERQYAGIELEVNQRFPLDAPKEWRVLQRDLLVTFSG